MRQSKDNHCPAHRRHRWTPVTWRQEMSVPLPNGGALHPNPGERGGLRQLQVPNRLCGKRATSHNTHEPHAPGLIPEPLQLSHTHEPHTQEPTAPHRWGAVHNATRTRTHPHGRIAGSQAHMTSRYQHTHTAHTSCAALAKNLSTECIMTTRRPRETCVVAGEAAEHEEEAPVQVPLSSALLGALRCLSAFLSRVRLCRLAEPVSS